MRLETVERCDPQNDMFRCVAFPRDEQRRERGSSPVASGLPWFATEK
jgi:hypothetical protein